MVTFAQCLRPRPVFSSQLRRLYFGAQVRKARFLGRLLDGPAYLVLGPDVYDSLQPLKGGDHHQHFACAFRREGEWDSRGGGRGRRRG